ncbi:transcriptional regulator, putative [hydrothermal vent metagenome]|uniref:Transcriptional regulator, putative n=1 Tax=hydrothermal vent metagenome TaxID=652676 RepID=A0A1W1D0K9_9ZZZZ
MSQKSSLYRTIEILKVLNAGQKVCVGQFAVLYEVSERTIRRDFELIKEIFGDFMYKEGNCYQAYKKILLEEVLSARDLMTLANIVNLFGITHKESVVSDRTKALVEKSMSVYDFKSRPYESMKNYEVIKQLEHAIKFHKEIRIFYRTDKNITQSNFHVYKILFLNENFYIVGENVSKHSFEFRRISLIVEVEYKKKTFIPHRDITKFIKNIQTPWASYGQEEKVVKIRADKKVRRFFILKSYLPSQKITKHYENGDILVEYRVTSIFELEELIIKWLPQVEIISPKNFKKHIHKRLKRKMYGVMKSVNLEK